LQKVADDSRVNRGKIPDYWKEVWCERNRKREQRGSLLFGLQITKFQEENEGDMNRLGGNRRRGSVPPKVDPGTRGKRKRSSRGRRAGQDPKDPVN